MPSPTLLLGPAASGKTHACLARVRAHLQHAPLSPVWVIVPDRHQAGAFRHRLAEAGGALGARIATFGDLYGELLALTDGALPLAPDPVLHRLVQAAVDAQAEAGQLQHYRPVQRRPGLVTALSDLIAELKRARIPPERWLEALRGRGRRLEELAQVYERYQALLIRLDWADREGLGWLAIEALERRPDLATGWYLVVDGFDSFTATQLDTLERLAGRVAALTLTLTGDPAAPADAPRLAHRRFARTLTQLQSRLKPETHAVVAPAARPAPLAHLEAALFAPEPRPVPAGPHVEFLEAQTQAVEAREAMRWLKARIVRAGVPPQACAVIARDLAPYQPFLHEAAREFGLPLFLARGTPLADNPALAALLNGLELPLRAWARRPLLDAVRSPYIDLSLFGLRASDAGRLDDVARLGQVIAGLDQWETALAALAEQAEAAGTDADRDPEREPPLAPTGAAARQLAAALATVAQRLTPPDRATTAGFVTWVESVMDDLRLAHQAAAQPDTAERDAAALEAFKDILRALLIGEAASLAGTAPAWTYAEFYTQLRGAVAAASYQPDGPSRRRAVYAADLPAARGVPYRAVAVLGLAEGLFPAPLSEDPFLSDDERLELNQRGVPIEPRLRSDQQSLFYEAVTRAAAHLLLTRPYLTDDGEAWEPSPYWQAARACLSAAPRRIRAEQTLALAEAASAPELLAAAQRRGGLPSAFGHLAGDWRALQAGGQVLAARLAARPAGPHEGDLAALTADLKARFGPAHTWSPSRLELYGTCGFQFLIGAALGLEPRQPPEPGLDAAQLGSLLHQILEAVYQAADPGDVDAVVAALPRVAQPIFAAAPRELGFRPTPLWEAQQAEWLAALETTLRQLAQDAADFRPAAFEQRFNDLELGTPAGPVRVRGVIDRVDRAPDGSVRVIDYKTGSSGLEARALIEGRRLQLPLYAAAAERALSLGRPVDGFYWAVLKGKAGSLALHGFDHTAADGRHYHGVAGALQLAAEHIGRSVTAIRAGQFAPQPPRDGCPSYCPAAGFCWRYTEH